MLWVAMATWCSVLSKGPIDHNGNYQQYSVIIIRMKIRKNTVSCTTLIPCIKLDTQKDKIIHVQVLSKKILNQRYFVTVKNIVLQKTIKDPHERMYTIYTYRYRVQRICGWKEKWLNIVSNTLCTIMIPIVLDYKSLEYLGNPLKQRLAGRWPQPELR